MEQRIPILEDLNKSYTLLLAINPDGLVIHTRAMLKTSLDDGVKLQKIRSTFKDAILLSFEIGDLRSIWMTKTNEIKDKRKDIWSEEYNESVAMEPYDDDIQ